MLDLFSGIGGFSLAGTWVWGADLDIVAFVEIDPFCQKVLKKHWPDVPIHDDIITFDPFQYSKIDIITGGFPCQDISFAGKGDGLDGKRSKLWKYMFKAICEIRPKYIIIENSPGLLIRGGTKVINEIASIGYSAQWQTISAQEIGAPHKRERIYIVAYPDALYGEKRMGNIFKRSWEIFKKSNESGDGIWIQAPNKIDRMDDGVPAKLYRMAIEGYGNAIVPQVAAQIMLAIKEIEGGSDD